MMVIDTSLSDYNFKEKEEFIVDTNVWLYLFSPFSVNDYGYSEFLSAALDKKCRLYVNNQIISEYINVICRAAYRNYLNNNHLNARNFKFKSDYQKTDDFQNYYKIACSSVKDDILKYSKILPIKLWHIRKGLNQFDTMNDFNDLVYVQMLSKKLKIVSHDKDFGSYPGNIVWLHF